MNARAWKVKVTSGEQAMLAPRFNKDPERCPIWAAGEIDQGSYVREEAWDGTAEHNKLYWTPNGGTASTSPTHRYGAATTPDGIVWVVVGVPRKALDLSADETNPVWVHDGAPGGVGDGLTLDEYRPAYTYDGYNGEVWALASGSDATIGVKER